METTDNRYQKITSLNHDRLHFHYVFFLFFFSEDHTLDYTVKSINFILKRYSITTGKMPGPLSTAGLCINLMLIDMLIIISASWQGWSRERLYSIWCAHGTVKVSTWPGSTACRAPGQDGPIQLLSPYSATELLCDIPSTAIYCEKKKITVKICHPTVKTVN